MSSYAAPPSTDDPRDLRCTSGGDGESRYGSAAAAGSTARFRPPRASTLSSVACRQCLKNFFARHTKYL